MLHLSHSEYYRDRRSVYELCQDFPEDEIYINGLHAMQSHFYTHNVPVEIPVVRVMNAAHFLLAYVFQTTCSDNQSEYDVLAYGSVGHDKKVMLLTLIVLAAMLKRTEGFRARMCRNMLLEDRSEDFYDGVSLYDQFLNSEEKHFAQEDFESDVMREIKQRDEIIAQQASQIITLQKAIKDMNQQNNHSNVYNGPVYNGPVFQGCNIKMETPAAPSVTPESDSAQPSSATPDVNSENPDSIIFTKKAKKEAKVAAIIEALKNSVQGRKDKTRAFVQELQSWQKEAYIDAHYNARVMYDELAKIIPLPFGYEVFKKHYNNTRS